MDNTKSIALINKYRGQIMGAAALWVVIYHTWYRQFSPETVPKILYYMELAIYKLGYFGVSIFFLLSGIGLSYAIGKYSLKEFWLRRFRRLAYPVLIAAAVLGIMEGWSFPHYLFAVTGIGFFIEKSYFLWFISAISAAYLVFPLYWRFFSRSRSKLRFTVLFIAALYLGSILVPKADNAIASSLYKLISNSCAPPFVLGVFFGWAQQNGGLKLSRCVFNTVPAPVFSREAVLALPAECIFLELASAPGGLAPEAPIPLGFLSAPGLPGRMYPESAAACLLACILRFSEKGDSYGA